MYLALILEAGIKTGQHCSAIRTYSVYLRKRHIFNYSLVGILIVYMYVHAYWSVGAIPTSRVY